MHRTTAVSVLRSHITFFLAAALVALGCAGEAQSAADSSAASDSGGGSGECSSVVVELEIGGWSTALIDRPEDQERLGKTAEFCAYNFPIFAWDKQVGDCAVTGVTFQGSEPIPDLFTVSKSFEKLANEVPVTKGGDLAWYWSGDVFNCDTAGCAESGLTQVELLSTDLHLADEIDLAMEKCPWTKVQARLELKPGK